HWQNVTPQGLTPWSAISLLEASPFDAGAAYAAVDRHRLDDFAPYIYRTRDGGAHWARSDQGIAPQAYVNAVRADPVRAGLLSAGRRRDRLSAAIGARGCRDRRDSRRARRPGAPPLERRPRHVAPPGAAPDRRRMAAAPGGADPQCRAEPRRLGPALPAAARRALRLQPRRYRGPGNGRRAPGATRATRRVSGAVGRRGASVHATAASRAGSTSTRLGFRSRRPAAARARDLECDGTAGAPRQSSES